MSRTPDVNCAVNGDIHAYGDSHTNGVSHTNGDSHINGDYHIPNHPELSDGGYTSTLKK